MNETTLKSLARRATLLLLLPCAFSEAPAQKVWVVAPNPGQGVDFVDIQAAVDAAGQGDVVLVRSGSYSGFEIRAKSLVVAGDGARSQLVERQYGLSVRDIDATQSVVISNFNCSTTAVAPLSVVNCDGPVTIEDGTFRSGFPVSFVAQATIVGSRQVSLIRCTLSGGSSNFYITSGLRVWDSTTLLHECTVTGGSAILSSRGGPNGAPGLDVALGFVSAYRSSFAGGQGTAGTMIGTICLPAGTGGDAVRLLDPSVVGFFQGCTLSPGPAGTAAPGCPAGNTGLVFGGSGTGNILSGPLGSLQVTSPVRSGQVAAVHLSGTPGTAVWLLVSALQSPLFVRGCNGALQPELSSSVAVGLGSMPASGSMTLNLPVPAQLPLPGLPAFLQLGLADATGCYLASPTALLMVDNRY